MARLRNPKSEMCLSLRSKPQFSTFDVPTILSIPNLESLETSVPAVFAALEGRRKIALHGEMGAGKTTFAKAFCRYLGVQDHTASPTYAIVNEYAYPNGDGEALVHHLDLYRLRHIEEALDLDIESLLADPWYCLIEWPELVEALLPDDVAHIYIEVSALGQRTLKIV